MVYLIEYDYGECHQQTWDGVNSGIGIDYLKKLELRNSELELKFLTKKLNPEINLPFL